MESISYTVGINEAMVRIYKLLLMNSSWVNSMAKDNKHLSITESCFFHSTMMVPISSSLRASMNSKVCKTPKQFRSQLQSVCGMTSCLPKKI